MNFTMTVNIIENEIQSCDLIKVDFGLQSVYLAPGPNVGFANPQ